MRIYVFGASGSGVTTLGTALAARLDYTYLDSDNYLWLPTDPPFTTKRDKAERQTLLADDLRQRDVVLGGCILNWDLPVLDKFDLGVFLYVPSVQRLERLQIRERQRFGDNLDQHPVINKNYHELLEWAAEYDINDTCSRTLAKHEEWLLQLPMPCLELRGLESVDQRLERVLDKIKSLNL